MNCYVRCNVCGSKFLHEEQLYRIKPCCRHETRFIADARKAINEKQLSDCFSEIEKNDCVVGEAVINVSLYVVLKDQLRLDQGVDGIDLIIWGARISLYSDELLIVQEENEI